MFALDNGRFDQFEGRVDASRHFDQYLNLGIVDDIEGLIGDTEQRQIGVPLFGQVADCDPFDSESRIIFKQFYDASPDCAEAQKADCYFRHNGSFLRIGQRSRIRWIAQQAFDFDNARLRA